MSLASRAHHKTSLARNPPARLWVVAQVAVANLLPLRHVLSVLEYRDIPYKRHPRRIRARRVRKDANTRRMRWRITDVDGVLRDGEGYEGQRAVAQAAYRSFH